MASKRAHVTAPVLSMSGKQLPGVLDGDLTVERCATWIERLLRADSEDQYPALNDRPLNDIVDAFGCADTLRRSLIRDAIAALVHRFLFDATDLEAESLFDLLDLAEKVNCIEALDDLRDAARVGRLKDRLAYGSLDLHEKLLLALGSLAKQLPEEVWIREMDDPRYTRAAWLGLFAMSPYRALPYLPVLARACRTRGADDLAFPLFLVMDEIGRLQGLREILRLAKLEEDTREEIVSCLRRLDVTDEELTATAVPDGLLATLYERVLSSSEKAIPAMEPLSLVRSVDDSPEPITLVVLEEAFRKYNRLWGILPTLDATAQAVNSAQYRLDESSDRDDQWLESRRGSIMRFMERCLGPGGFGIAPENVPSPGLYPSLCGIGVAKALASIPRKAPLHLHRAQLAEALGADFALRLENALRTLLGNMMHDGLLVDSSRDEPTVHALDFGLAIAWNLGLRFEEIGVHQLRVEEFFRACERECGAGVGFTAHPEGGMPCTTTTSMALRIFHRANWRSSMLMERTPRIAAFLMEMIAESGGFRVFPLQPPTLSATAFSLDALAMVGELDRFLAHNLSRVRAFLKSCRRSDGGFAFTSAGAFSSNVHSVRYALRAHERLGERLEDPKSLLAFLAAVFDEASGGFYGYEPAVGSREAVA